MRHDTPGINPFLATLMIALVLLSAVLGGIVFLGADEAEPAAPGLAAAQADGEAPGAPANAFPSGGWPVPPGADPVSELRDRLTLMESDLAALREEGREGTEQRQRLQDAIRKQKDLFDQKLQAAAEGQAGDGRSGQSQDMATLRRDSAKRSLGKARSKQALLSLLGTYQERALDETRSAQSRLQALRMLHAYGGRTTDVARAMMELLAGTDDPRLRAAILRELHGVEDAEVAEGLIHHLLQDDDAGVRREAAANLEIYARNDDVRWALEEAGRKDASESVREAARTVLQANR